MRDRVCLLPLAAAPPETETALALDPMAPHPHMSLALGKKTGLPDAREFSNWLVRACTSTKFKKPSVLVVVCLPRNSPERVPNFYAASELSLI